MVGILLSWYSCFTALEPGPIWSLSAFNLFLVRRPLAWCPGVRYTILLQLKSFPFYQ